MTVLKNFPADCIRRGSSSLKFIVQMQQKFDITSPHKFSRTYKSASWMKHPKLRHFYDQPEVDKCAQKKEDRISPYTLLYIGDSPHHSNTLLSARYLSKELPVRFAHTIQHFRNLPFAIGCNPELLYLHEKYIESFHKLNKYKKIYEQDDAKGFLRLMHEIQANHRDDIATLADGIKTTRRQNVLTESVQKFLDLVLTSRLGTKLLIEHHIGLVEDRADYVGVINVKFSPKQLIECLFEDCRRQCEHLFGKSPPVHVNGHLEAVLPCILPPVEYAVGELLKNALRATVEYHNTDKGLPHVNVTIAVNPVEFIIRISDRGGGIPHRILPHVFEYQVTESHQRKSTNEAGMLSALMSPDHSSPTGGPMYGYGFGLPLSRAYAEYMGGSLKLETMQGIGTDAYLRFKQIQPGGYRL